jgi:SH3-like domain-containing protein
MKKTFLLIVLSIFFLAGEASAKRIAVSVDKANIRSGPGTNYGVIWSAGKYYPFNVIKQSGEWLKVRDFEDDEGWIFHKNVESLPAVIIKVPLANVREGPGETGRLLFQAEKGVSLKRLGTKGKWLKVEHSDGEVGWIHESLVW